MTIKIIHDECVDILKTYFEFDEIFDLVDFDHDMSVLYKKLELLKKEEYKPNYRFIFLHYDTEYYINQYIPGLTLLNLQRILSSLDIPNYFCLILSNQHIQKQLDWLRQHESTDSCSITCITNYLHRPMYQEYDDNVQLNNQMIANKYICLNRAKRFHRRLLVSALKSKNLLGDGIVSYGN